MGEEVITTCFSNEDKLSECNGVHEFDGVAETAELVSFYLFVKFSFKSI